MAKQRPDRRRFDVDEHISIFLKTGEGVKGTVYAVQYEEPEGPERNPEVRHSFRYIVHIADREIGNQNQADPKTGKLKKVKVYEPVYQTISEDQLKD